MARSKSKNLGVIGLGIIGARIAAVLRKRGFQVFVWNRTPRLEPNFVGSPAEVAELCHFIQIFVADDAALLEIVQLLVPALDAQHIITAHCTVAPESMREAARLVERRGARFLEAPFTGSKVAAENGQLVYYIGGDEMALKAARPTLELTSKEIIPIGEIGSASIIKVATNIVTAANAQIAAEALAIVRQAGISGETFTRAMKSNASNSTTLEMKVPMMLQGEFEPHFSVKHMLKDVRIAAKLGRQFGLELPMTEVASDVLLAEMKQGRGEADYASVAQKYFPVSARPFVPAKPAFGAKVEPEKPIAIEKPAPAEKEAEVLKPEEPKGEEAKPVEVKAEEATLEELELIEAREAEKPGVEQAVEARGEEPEPEEAKAEEPEPAEEKPVETGFEVPRLEGVPAAEVTVEELQSEEVNLEEPKSQEPKSLDTIGAKKEAPEAEERQMPEAMMVALKSPEPVASESTPDELPQPKESETIESAAAAPQPSEGADEKAISSGGETDEAKARATEAKETEPVNLSGGSRGWLRRLFSGRGKRDF